MTKWCDAVTTDVQIGNALAGAIGTSPDDDRTFDYGRKLRTAGGPNVETARATGGPMSDAVAALVVEFMSDGPYPNLNARGISDAMIAAGRQCLHIQVTEYGEQDTLAFWQSLGYEQLTQAMPNTE